MRARHFSPFLLLAAAVACQEPQPQPQPKQPADASAPAAAAAPATKPRDASATSKEQQKAIEELRQRLEQKETTVDAILQSQDHMDLHDKTPFRELLKAHATAAPVTMSPAAEPGPRLVLRGRIVSAASAPADRAPLANALVYAYHTDVRGFYGYERAHVLGNSGDFKHARLFAYVRTDKEGRFELRTIRPASYPDTDLPQHIHFEVTADEHAAMVTEIFFDDDPMLDAEQRAQAARHEVPIVAVATAAGVTRCEVELQLQQKRPR